MYLLSVFRSWKGFNDILDVYRWAAGGLGRYSFILSIVRLGRLHFNCGGVCPIRMNSIIEFWQIDELLLGKLGLDYKLLLGNLRQQCELLLGKLGLLC